MFEIKLVKVWRWYIGQRLRGIFGATITTMSSTLIGLVWTNHLVHRVISGRWSLTQRALPELISLDWRLSANIAERFDSIRWSKQEVVGCQSWRWIVVNRYVFSTSSNKFRRTTSDCFGVGRTALKFFFTEPIKRSQLPPMWEEEAGRKFQHVSASTNSFINISGLADFSASVVSFFEPIKLVPWSL